MAILAFIKLWSYYLQYRKFTLRTDCSAFNHLKDMAYPVGMTARWLSVLAAHEFDIEVVKRNKNVQADGMSRREDAPTLDEQFSDDEGGPSQGGMSQEDRKKLYPVPRGNEKATLDRIQQWTKIHENDENTKPNVKNGQISMIGNMYKCPVQGCGNIFRHEAGLGKHVHMAHPRISLNAWRCQYCQDTFETID